MIPVDKIPPEILKKIFEQDMIGKKLDMLGAIWKVTSTNAKKNKISIALIGIKTPKEISNAQK